MPIIYLIYFISFICFCRTVQYFPYRQAYPFSLSLSHSHSHAPFVKCCRACFAICRTVAFGIYTKRRMRTRRTRRTRSETYSNGLRIFIFDCHLILTETRLRFICFTILNLIVCFYFDSALSPFRVSSSSCSFCSVFYSAGAFYIPTHPTVVLFHSSS